MMVDLEPSVWWAAVLLGGLAGLDGESWPQMMLSRPLVSTTLGGGLLGDPAAGLAAGAVLELLALRHLPLGGASRPDTGPAGVVAGAAAAGAGGGAAAVAAAALAGWAAGWLGHWTVRRLRALSARWAADEDRLSRMPSRLERRHLALILLDFGRSGGVTASLLAPALLLARLPSMADPDRGRGAGWEPEVLVALAAAVAAGAAARSLSPPGPTAAWSLLGGALFGVVLAVLF